MSISPYALAFSLALGAFSLGACVPANAAESATGQPAKSGKHKAGKASGKAPGKAPGKAGKTAAKAEPNEEVDEPDTAGSSTTEFDCELGNKITIYQNDTDDQHIALRWKKRLHRLTRIGTTTGAQRFENRNYGLIWIGIPAKGMLLDSKQNRQLANECRNAEQSKPAAAPEAVPVPAAPVDPVAPASATPAGASAPPEAPAASNSAPAAAAPASVPSVPPAAAATTDGAKS